MLKLIKQKKDKLLYIDNNKLSKLISKALNTKNLIKVVYNGSETIKYYILIFYYKSKKIFIEWWDLWKQKIF